MSYLTFTAPTLNEAKQAMRAELGNGAVILATKKRSDGQVEIRAIQKGMPLFPGEGPATPTPVASPAAGATGARGLAARSRQQPRPKTASPSPDQRQGTGIAENIEKSASGQALSELRGDMSQKLGREADGFADSLHREMHRRLSPHGLSDRLIAALHQAVRGRTLHDEISTLREGFAQVMRFAPIAVAPGAPIMLVGQTGAGKTSSSAKLAARAAGEGFKAAFLCADIGRAGAIEQMQTYSQALDTRFWQIEDPQDVSAIIRNEQSNDIFILDTPGVSPFAPSDIAVLRAYRDALDGEPIFVLPASGDMHEHIDWAKAFAEIGVRRCIITKFDTSRRVGAAISAAFEAGLTLAHFSEAPFIADGLADASPDYLAHRFLLEDPARIAGTF